MYIELSYEPYVETYFIHLTTLRCQVFRGDMGDPVSIKHGGCSNQRHTNISITFCFLVPRDSNPPYNSFLMPNYGRENTRRVSFLGFDR